jgi:hypothetical protein
MDLLRMRPTVLRGNGSEVKFMLPSPLLQPRAGVASRLFQVVKRVVFT